MSGRKKNPNFDKLGFNLKKENNKYFAVCIECNKILKNTASDRLKVHRNICPRSDENGSQSIIDLSQSEILPAALDMSIDDVQVVEIAQEAININNLNDLIDNFSEENASTTSNTTQLFYLPIENRSTIPSGVQSSSSSTSSIFDKNNPPICQAPYNISTSKSKKAQKAISQFMDVLGKKEEIEINELLGKFFFGCNIPFSVVESAHSVSIAKVI